MKFINISINLDKINQDNLIAGEKGTYLPLTLFINDEDDQYGNNTTCWQKHEKGEERIYLGNGRAVDYFQEEKPKSKTPTKKWGAK